jgi:hypothetical protein
MRVVSGTGRAGALAGLYATHEHGFRVPAECYVLAAYRALGAKPPELDYRVRSCPRYREAWRGLARGVYGWLYNDDEWGAFYNVHSLGSYFSMPTFVVRLTSIITCSWRIFYECDSCELG